jgi:hypothetical protein
MIQSTLIDKAPLMIQSTLNDKATLMIQSTLNDKVTLMIQSTNCLVEEELNKLVLCYSASKEDSSSRRIQVAEKCRLYHPM